MKINELVMGTGVALIAFGTTGFLFGLYQSSDQDIKKKETYISISSSYYGEMHLTKDEFQRYFERNCAENKFTIMSSRLVDSAIEMNYKNILLVPTHLQTNGLWRLAIKTDISALKLDLFGKRDDYGDLVEYSIELYGEEESVKHFI